MKSTGGVDQGWGNGDGNSSHIPELSWLLCVCAYVCMCLHARVLTCACAYLRTCERAHALYVQCVLAYLRTSARACSGEEGGREQLRGRPEFRRTSGFLLRATRSMVERWSCHLLRGGVLSPPPPFIKLRHYVFHWSILVVSTLVLAECLLNKWISFTIRWYIFKKVCLFVSNLCTQGEARTQNPKIGSCILHHWSQPGALHSFQF